MKKISFVRKNPKNYRSKNEKTNEKQEIIFTSKLELHIELVKLMLSSNNQIEEYVKENISEAITTILKKI